MSMAKQIILCLAALIAPTSAGAEDLLLEKYTADGQFFEWQNREARCQQFDDGGYRWPCSDGYRIELSRRSVHGSTFLDRLILMADDFRRFTFDTGFGQDTKLDFEIRGLDVFKMGGDFKLTLKIKF
jgi:hypothetical protein